MIAQVRQRGYDVVGDLNDLLPVLATHDVGQSAATRPEVTEAEVADIAVHVVADLLDQRWRDLTQLQALRAARADRTEAAQSNAVDPSTQAEASNP